MRAFFVLTLLVLLAGCSSTKTVGYRTLERQAMVNVRGFYPDTIYYCGTQENYDHFYIEHGASDTLTEGQSYRVPSSETAIKERFPFTKHRSAWKRMNMFNPSEPSNTRMH